MDDVCLEVNVLPTKRADLALAHARNHREFNRCGERGGTVARKGLAQAFGLGWRQCVDWLGTAFWSLNEVERVAAKVSDFACPGENLLYEYVDVRDGGWGKTVLNKALLPAHDLAVRYVGHAGFAEYGALEVTEGRSVALCGHDADITCSLLVLNIREDVFADGELGTSRLL